MLIFFQMFYVYSKNSQKINLKASKQRNENIL